MCGKHEASTVTVLSMASEALESMFSTNTNCLLHILCKSEASAVIVQSEASTVIVQTEASTVIAQI